MTFASKYEILEPVTSGSVETFVARSLATDERVLVHIFQCPEQRPDQPTVQWVLESFYAIAPEPPELVLGTGRYGGTTYAYLVTKLPASTLLDQWVRSYQARQGTPVESPFPGTVLPQQSGNSGVEETLQATPTTVLVAPAPEQPRVTDTPEQIVSDSDHSIVSDGTLVQERDETDLSAAGPLGIDFRPGKAEQPEPGDFTRQFFSGQTNASEGPAQSSPSSSSESVDRVQPALSVQAAPPAAESSSEASEKRHLSPSYKPSRPEISLKDGSTTDETIKTGEFTSFFQGPFHGDRAAKVPPVSSAWAQAKNDAGEFTKVFGASRNTPASEGTSSPRFTEETSRDLNREQISDLLGSAKTPEPQTQPPQQTEILEANRGRSADFPEPSPQATAASQISNDRPQPNPGGFSSGSSWHDANTAFIFRPKKEAATSAFAAPGTEPGLARANLPVGPSEFTKVISGGLRNPESAEEEPAAAEPPDFLEKVGPPAAPSGLPSFRAPSPPGQFPQAGSFPQAPAPPTGIPALPQTPQLGAADPKVAGTPWTLILVMNGLFLVAVLLVLYFALKH